MQSKEYRIVKLADQHKSVLGILNRFKSVEDFTIEQVMLIQDAVGKPHDIKKTAQILSLLVDEGLVHRDQNGKYRAV